jgi:hypothetical protein
MPSRYDVFVSYAKADRSWVEGFLLALVGCRNPVMQLVGDTHGAAAEPVSPVHTALISCDGGRTDPWNPRFQPEDPVDVVVLDVA